MQSKVKVLKKIILLNKKEGETPLEALLKFRKKHREYKNISMTYAGRLDPMATGILLVLVGATVHQKEKYLALSKEYKFKVLFGFATDTYDILGLVKNKKLLNLDEEKELKKSIQDNLKHFIGKFMQKYPLYSSKTVKGKALFQYAREGETVEIPKRKVFVRKIELNNFEKIEAKKLLDNITKRVKKVNGDFRQEKILKVWKKNILITDQKFLIANIEINCSSGTYVRSIADELGQLIGMPALAFSIKRTKLGKWSKI